MPAALARLYAARGVRSTDELDYTLPRLLPPAALGQTDAAAALLAHAVTQDHRILILADYDCDGATSCALAVRALTAMGARQVSYLVPNRFEYGYGLTPEIVALAAQQQPDLLVTVDNGISSVEGVAAARAAGMRVLVTDHHLPGPSLPEADVIVNPNQPGDSFPSKVIAGVGVIFYVMLALRARLRAEGWFARPGGAEPALAELLDLVALGTIADVVPLDHNNRLMVAQGLRRIRSGRACPGIQALITVAGREAARLTSTDLAFALGPRINAAGRLTDMSLGIACLLADDAARARDLVLRLDKLNKERREIEGGMQTHALEALDSLQLEGDLPWGLCLYAHDWHPGVVGILAGRVKDRLHRPVIAFANAGPDEIRGSARSVPGLHIRDCLDTIAARHPGLLVRFGGHAMAAGLTLSAERLPQFRQAFDAVVRETLDADQLEATLISDGELAGNEITVELARSLADAGPWGSGFPEPLFDGRFQLRECRPLGERHRRYTLVSPGGQRGEPVLQAVHFNPQGDAPTPGMTIEIAYQLDIDHWSGQERLRLVVRHLSVPTPAPLAVS